MMGRMLQAGLVVALLSCGGDDATPTGPVIRLENGTYEGIVEVSGQTFFPQEDGADFLMTVDRENGRVEIRYVQSGSVVIEYWSIASTRTD